MSAQGYKCDTIYISEDTKWDITDLQLGDPVCSWVNIFPYGNNQANDLSFQSSQNAPFVAQQSYTGIVRTRSNIRDPSLENNIGLTNIPLDISAPNLTLDIPTSVTLRPGEEKVYRIDGVPSEETLSAVLTTSGKTAFHNLFLQHEKPPTGFEFDAFSKHALSFNQTAVIHSTRLGTYYLLIKSNGRGSGTYEVEVLVKIAKFEILAIIPKAASPLGNVTIHFIGTVLSYYIQAELTHEDYGSYSALNVYWFDSENVYATFNATALPAGVYSARLTDNGRRRSNQLNNSFSIQEGIPGQLAVRVIAPQRLVFNATGRVTISLQNVGNTDILVPILTIQSSGNALFRQLDEAAPLESFAEYTFIPTPLSGPGGILSPLAISQIEFEVFPRDEFFGDETIIVTQFDNLTEPHAYLDAKDALKPEEMPNHVWDIIWNNFLESVGTTWQSFNQRVSEIATLFTLSGRRIFGVRDIVDYQLGIAYGILSGNY